MTPTQLVELLDVTYQTLANWRVRGNGPEYVKLSPGRQGAIRYSRKAVDEWLKSRTLTSTSA
ncbi:helix-turn-helix transcriptional regulator [Streptomyces sp. NPDC057257]|uniref:helix-turn-helix transcriptional regulator n=1 Tax=Streptomyces sp. NPDC057257 TaxID=3346071 RepID=UPI003640875B